MKRVLELDALRGISAVVIMLAHIRLIPGTPWVLSAVDLFFVLSGYFITRTILANRRSNYFLPNFFVRRALRIWPAYYAALAACLLINPAIKWDNPTHAWPYYLTFTQNVHEYFGIATPLFSVMFLHTWTLAIEEQFYVMWPLLMFRAGRTQTLLIILSFATLPGLLRASGYSSYLLFTRCDGLALGGLLAFVMADKDWVARRLGSLRSAFVLVGVSALIVPMIAGRYWDSVSSVLFTTRAAIVYFGLAGFILIEQGRPILRPLRDPRLCHLGLISYGLYLYHPLVFGPLPKLYRRFLVRKLGVPSHAWLEAAAMILVCVAIAELSRCLLEDPILALKDRLTFGSREGTVTPILQGPHLAWAPAEVDHLVSVDGSTSHETRNVSRQNSI